MLDHLITYVGTDPLVFTLATVCLAGMLWWIFLGAKEGSFLLASILPLVILLALLCGTILGVNYAWFYLPILLALACLSILFEFTPRRRTDSSLDQVRVRLDAIVHICLFAFPIMTALAIYSSTVSGSTVIAVVFLFLGIAALVVARTLHQGAIDAAAVLEARDASYFQDKQSLQIKLESAQASMRESQSDAHSWSERAQAASEAARIASQQAREASAESDRREAENREMLKEAARKAGIDRRELDGMRQHLQATQKNSVIIQGRRLFHTLTGAQTAGLIELMRTELLKEGAIEGASWMKITHLVALESVNSELAKWDVEWVDEGLDLRPGVLWEGIQVMHRVDEVLVKPGSIGGTEWTERVSLSRLGANSHGQQKESVQMTTNIGAQFFGGSPNIDQIIAQVTGNAYYKTAGEELQSAVKQLLATAGETAKSEPAVKENSDLAVALDDVTNAKDRKGLKKTIVSVMGLAAAIGKAAEPILESAKSVHDMLAT